MNTPVLSLYPRGLCDEMQHTVTTIEQTPEGLYVTSCAVVLEELNEAERKHYDECVAEWEAMAAHYADQPGPPEPAFATIEHAVAYARACCRMADTSYDLRAFGAPSECYADALPPREAEIDEALQHAVN